MENDILIQGKTLRLWANVRKSREDRARNPKLIKMAEAVQTALNEGHKDNILPAYKVLCWKSATIVLNGKRIVTPKRSDMTTTTTDAQLLIKWHDDWYDRCLYSQTEPWVDNEVIARPQDLEL